ncbi:glutathione S-transferase family protein [Pannonibacter sp. Pt2-lr]|uniref:Glutathione S-transferase family protein n=1 Tax=Pannonibacter anstelovis TaxID=3121537 RepID=A0ABU7ZLB3_9HYPH
MYKVIGVPQSRASRIYWLLEELGQPYEIVPAKPHSQEVLAVNPNGKIPVLMDGDVALTDSTAILHYLADKHGSCTFKAGTIDRAMQDSFTMFCLDEIEGALWTGFKNTVVHPEGVRVPDVMRACKAELTKALDILAKRLGTKTYVMGDTFTVADIIITNCLMWGASIPEFGVPKEGPIPDYVKRTTSRPAFKAAGKRIAGAQT